MNACNKYFEAIVDHNEFHHRLIRSIWIKKNGDPITGDHLFVQFLQ